MGRISIPFMPSGAADNIAFSGREVETARLVAALGELERGRGALFLISGEPGIGKTRLAEEVAGRVKERGGVVAWGAAWDGGGAPAYWPWTEVLRALRNTLPEPSSEFGRDLGPLWGDSRLDADEDPEALLFRRSDALRAALAMAAARAPLLVVLDDLHAADRATLHALHFVARSLRSLPILLVGTHRECDARLRPEVALLLAKIAREGSTLSLPCLGRDAVFALMRDFTPLAPGTAERIFEVTGGNPFFVHELLRLVRSGAPADRIPDGVRALVSERLQAFDRETRATLELAAVLGRETTLTALSSLAGFSQHELDRQLEAPRLAGIVESDERGRVRFCHPLFRECLYEGLSSLERARLHHRAGRALELLLGSDAALEESVARHFLLALPEGDPVAAVQRARAAALRCRRALAFDRAVELLERAVAALAGVSEPEPLRTDTEIDLAEALVFVGEGERSRSLCLDAVARARARGDAHRFSRAVLAHGAEIRVGVSDPVQVALLEEAERLLGEGEPALRARVMARLAATRLSLTREGPIALAQSAIALARSTGDGDTLLQALHMGGAALVCYAPPADRRGVDEELAKLALGRHELVLAQRGHQRLAIDAAELGERADFLEALRAEEQIGRMLGHARFRWRSALLRSQRALTEGRWADSESAIEEAARFVAEADDPAGRFTLAVHRVGAARARYTTELAAFERFSADPVIQGGAGEVMGPLMAASAFLRAGDKERARAELNKVPLDERLFFMPHAVNILAATAAGLGERRIAAEVLPVLEAIPYAAISWGATGYIWDGFVSDTVGALLAVLDRRDEAVLELEKATEAGDLFAARPAAAESRITLAAVLAARAVKDDRERAQALLDAAESVATELGMQASLLRLKEARALLSNAPAAGTASAPALSFDLRREGEVWAVMSGGKTALLKHTRALEILKQLVEHPGREFHVLDLGPDGEPGSALDTGDAGEVIDLAAKAAYEKRLGALRSEVEEAERWNDAGRRARLQAELEFLEDELGRGVGKGGKLRRSASAAERARVNVYKRLKGVIERLATDLPEAARHLKVCVRTGIFVSYHPGADPGHVR